MLPALRPYRITIVFKPGQEIPVADALSCLHPHDDGKPSKMHEKIAIYVHAIMSSLPVHDAKFEAIKKATTTDKEMVKLASVIKSGWPSSFKSCPAEIVDYWNYREELAVQEGVAVGSYTNYH